MSYTLGTAAKATGKSKSTIHRAIKDGKISATRDDSGTYHIDAAELHRVFPPVSQDSSTEPDVTQYATHDGTQMMRREIEMLQEERVRERQQLQDTINDLRHRLDEETAERRKANMLLTHKVVEAEPKRGFWSRLFRGKS